MDFTHVRHGLFYGILILIIVFYHDLVARIVALFLLLHQLWHTVAQ